MGQCDRHRRSPALADVAQDSAAIPHALLVRHEPAGGSIDARPGLRAAEEKPSEVAGDFVKFVTNGEIEAGEAQAFDRAVQDVREQESA